MMHAVFTSGSCIFKLVYTAQLCGNPHCLVRHQGMAQVGLLLIHAPIRSLIWHPSVWHRRVSERRERLNQKFVFGRSVICLRLDFDAASQKLLGLFYSFRRLAVKESILFWPSPKKELRLFRTVADATCSLAMFTSSVGTYSISNGFDMVMLFAYPDDVLLISCECPFLQCAQWHLYCSCHPCLQFALAPGLLICNWSCGLVCFPQQSHYHTAM